MWPQGKLRGPKQYSGDHKTPEGIYIQLRTLSLAPNFFSDMEKKEKSVRGGAFTLDYPNSIDHMNKKQVEEYGSTPQMMNHESQKDLTPEVVWL